MQKNNAEYDICLIFPPDAGIELCPPAGIPSLVSYIKTKGFRPLVIDLDSVFKKSFLAQNILIHLQGTIMFLFKEMFPGRNITAIDTSYKDTRFNLLELSKNSVALILHYIYKYLIILRIVFFRYKRKRIKSLDHILDDFTDNGYIDKRFNKILTHSMQNIKIVGISVLYPQQIVYALTIAKLIKNINKDIFIVVGGSQITMHINKILNNKNIINYVDGLMVHEGEVSLASLLKGEAPQNIPNFYYKDVTLMAYKASEKVDFLMPTKEYMPPDFEGFNIANMHYNALPIRTLRGCFWGKCRFCSYPYVGGRFDLTNPEFVINNISKLKINYNINSFEFIDSSIPAVFLRNIAEEIIAKNLDINWYCRVNYETTFQDIEFLSLLKKSGCVRLTFGLESGSSRIMSYMNKLQKEKSLVEDITKNVRAAKIIPGIYVMFGFPTETKEEMEETLDFVMNLKLKYKAELIFSVFNLLEHTYIYDNPSIFKIDKILNNEEYAFHGYGYPFTCSEGANRKTAYRFWNKAILLDNIPLLNRLNSIFIKN